MKFSYPFADLGDAFSQPIRLSPLDSPVLCSWNNNFAKELGLKQVPEQFIELINGQTTLDRPAVASLYAGHQFGSWVPQLGDGRAAVLGQLDSPSASWELQIKGGGPTPFSRSGDGRAVLRSSIREYLCSEAMHALGIPTTRALCLIDSKTPVYREEVETGALVVRAAPTHIRFGSFEVFASRDQTAEVKKLADFVIENFYPKCLEAEKPYLAFYKEVISGTAKMIAGWMSQGFAHGVMNSDNMSILGLTLDYGPFGFMENYEPGFICNHSDHYGRYAFNQQPNIASWNLGALGNSLLSLISVEDAQAALNGFKQLYLDAYNLAMCGKLGILEPDNGDDELISELLKLMSDTKADYSQTFRLLSRQSSHRQAAMHFGSSIKFKNWVRRFIERTKDIEDHENLMLERNPKYVLRNYMAQIAIEHAVSGDYSEIERLLNLLLSPFDEHPEDEEFFNKPPDWAKGLSVSCSS